MKYIKIFEDFNFELKKIDYSISKRSSRFIDYSFIFMDIEFSVSFMYIDVSSVPHWQRDYGLKKYTDNRYQELKLSPNKLVELVSIVNYITTEFIEAIKPKVLMITHINMNNESNIDGMNKRAKMNYRFLKNSIPSDYKISYYSAENTICYIYNKSIDIAPLVKHKIWLL